MRHIQIFKQLSKLGRYPRRRDRGTVRLRYNKVIVIIGFTVFVCLLALRFLHGKLLRKKGRASSVMGCVLPLDFGGAISSITFVFGGTLKGSCSITSKVPFSKSTLRQRKPSISDRRIPYGPPKITGISQTVPSTRCIKAFILLHSGIFPQAEVPLSFHHIPRRPRREIVCPVSKSQNAFAVG